MFTNVSFNVLFIWCTECIDRLLCQQLRLPQEFEEIRKALGGPAFFIDEGPTRHAKSLIEIGTEDDIGLEGFRDWMRS